MECPDFSFEWTKFWVEVSKERERCENGKEVRLAVAVRRAYNRIFKRDIGYLGDIEERILAQVFISSNRENDIATRS